MIERTESRVNTSPFAFKLFLAWSPSQPLGALRDFVATQAAKYWFFFFAWQCITVLNAFLIHKVLTKEIITVYVFSLRSKRFIGVWEQRETEERDFRYFACAENGARAKKDYPVILCSRTGQKRLLRRLKCVWISDFINLLLLLFFFLPISP